VVDSVYYLLEAERLCNPIVGVKDGGRGLQVSRGGNDDRPGSRRKSELTLARAEREGIHRGHHEVKQDEVRFPAIEMIERFVSVGGGSHLVPYLYEHLRERFAQGVVVLHHQDPPC
jgi:hypothetical protein